MSQTIFVYENPAEIAAACAAMLEVKCAAAILARGACHLALSGGSTPKALFELLATPGWAARFDWPRIHLWFSDERDVPSDDPQSNFNSADVALIRKINIPAGNIHRVQTELGAANAADGYEAEIRAALPAPFAFDVILLGMGDDGHTASLFPGTLAGLPDGRLAVAHFVPKVNMQRITFTFGLINAARCVIFLVAGAAKANPLGQVLGLKPMPAVLPSALVQPAGELVWLVDKAALGQG